MKILLQHRVEGEQLKRLEDIIGNEHTYVLSGSHEEIAEEGKDTDIFFGFCSEEIFPLFPNIKWIQASSAGMDRHMYPAIRESDVILTNAAGLYATHVADQAFALLLGLARGIHQTVRNQDQHKWGGLGTPMIEIDGFKMGIVGLGGIGMEMVKRAKGFDMHVIAVDAYRTEKPDNVDELMPMDKLKDLMSQVDVVMIACPLTEETRGLINADNLSVMQPSSYFINVARGPIVKEDDLIQILRENKIAGAGLDVTEVEPLDSDSPLWDFPNVIISPHSAGGSQHRMNRITSFFLDNLERYLNGEELKNIVNKELGF
ncbi:D-2-hydroxyacid dehydrogenase [Candidatus Poribacteria bacterium]|nr:MAG: D-2-hydroxyacid dehydrogenase [Candidatus Poribacteria bacterium]